MRGPLGRLHTWRSMPRLRALGLITGGLWIAACSKPFWKAPPPAPEPVFPARLMDAEIDSISLTQTPCFGLMARRPTRGTNLHLFWAVTRRH
jgi:hypothetical protein